MNVIDKFCQWYLGRKQQKAQKVQQEAKDKKLEEAGAKIKALYEFVKLLNTQILRNRNERKGFWRNVSEGRPLVEDTLLNILRRLEVKEETIQKIQEAKFRNTQPPTPVKKVVVPPVAKPTCDEGCKGGCDSCKDKAN